MTITQEKVWMKYYTPEAQKVTIPACTAYSYVKQETKDLLDTTAVHYYGTNISYRALFARVEEYAKAYAALGVKSGDIVSFLSVAIPESIASVYALNKLGAAANMIDPRMDVDSIARMVKGCGSKFLVVVDVAFPKVRKIMDEIRQERIIVQSFAASMPLVKRVALKFALKLDVTYSDKVIPWKQFVENGKDTVAKEAPYVGDALVAITYTGGTTGFSKGVMLTNDSMNAVSVNFKYWGLVHEKGDRFLGIIPIFSAYGMVCGMHMPLCMGLEYLPIPKFDPTQFGKLVKTYRPQHIISTPAFYNLLMDSKEVKGLDLSFLITLGSGGDTMNEGLEQKLNQFMKEHHIKYPLAQGYGLSEVSAPASFCANETYKPGSVGIPSLTTNIGIFDPDTGEELGYYEHGEVCVTGPSMMKGYFNAPEETANVMRKHDDGLVWIHTGDVGYMDEDGFLFIKGRIKRMITRFDGHKVFPVNLESKVGERSDVANCAVIGINDREHAQGQYPMVLVELMEGTDRNAVCKEIFDDCQAHVEERGKPVAVVAIDEIPLTNMGKNDNKKLEEIYANFDYNAWNPMA